jgi:hypothetical protein
MPQEVDASTQNSIVDGGGGFDSNEPQNSAERRVRHQLMSEITLGLGVNRTNGEGKWLNEVVNLEIDGKRDRPSGTAKEQCTSVPSTASASFLENLWPLTQGSSLAM